VDFPNLLGPRPEAGKIPQTRWGTGVGALSFTRQKSKAEAVPFAKLVKRCLLPSW